MEAKNHFEEQIATLINPAQLILGVTDLSSNIKPDTIKLFFWDVIKSFWIPLLGTYDSVAKTLTAQTNHFSKFAAFGEKVDGSAPQTIPTVTGQKINADYYAPSPILKLAAEDEPGGSGVAKVFYSVDGSEAWEEYAFPIMFDELGTHAIQFRSMDKVGNLENIKDVLIRTSDSTNPPKILKVSEALFNSQ